MKDFLGKASSPWHEYCIYIHRFRLVYSVHFVYSKLAFFNRCKNKMTTTTTTKTTTTTTTEWIQSLSLGAYIILDALEGVLIERGLIRAGLIRGGLFTKSNDKAIFCSVSVVSPYFRESTYNFTGQIHKFDSFSPKPDQI